MTPTNKLRFVEREKVTVDLFCNASYQKIRILQQWWEGKTWNANKDQLLDGEWRDIPVEKEA
jgi:hypothetical protein